MQDKIILVTGAVQGYGQAIADALGDAGATVILVDKSIKKLEQQYDRMLEAGAPKPAILPLNLTGADAGAFDTIVKAVTDNFEHLDGMVLNAVEFAGLTPILNFTPERWYSLMQTNLNANFHLIQLFAPSLRASGAGKVVYVHDPVADTREPYWGAYSVSKAAMLALIETLQREQGEQTDITYSSVRPEPMATGVRQRITPAGTVTGGTAQSQVGLVLSALGFDE